MVPKGGSEVRFVDKFDYEEVLKARRLRKNIGDYARIMKGKQT